MPKMLTDGEGGSKAYKLEPGTVLAGTVKEVREDATKHGPRCVLVLDKAVTVAWNKPPKDEKSLPDFDDKMKGGEKQDGLVALYMNPKNIPVFAEQVGKRIFAWRRAGNMKGIATALAE